MATDDVDEEYQLASFAATCTLADLDEGVRDRTRRVLTDSVAAMVGGSTADEVRCLAQECPQHGPCTVFGHEITTTRERAALLNGTAGTSLEVDEGHRYAAGHPAMHVIPAVLAEAEAQQDGNGANEDGETLFAATVAGYEVATRIGIATSPLREEYHMHGVWGTVGGAAGVARYRGLSAADTLTAMRIAANFALHTRWETAIEGATIRNAYAGVSNLHAILAVDQAVAGVTGLDRGVERHLERTTRSGFNREALVDELGSSFEIERGYFKLHSACRYTHGSIDAIAALQSNHDLSPKNVNSVHVETYKPAATLDDPAPENPLQARFSIPFAVATRLIRGHAGKAAFEADTLDLATLDLASKVTVAAATDLDDMTPEVRPTRITVVTDNGRRLTEEIRYPLGDERNPIGSTQLREKWQSLLGSVLSKSRADDVVEALHALPDVSPGKLCRLCRNSGEQSP